MRGLRSYDGSKDCLLNHLVQTAKFEFVFAWELLPHYSAMVTSNMTVTFYGFWCARHYLELPGGRMPGVHRIAQLPAWGAARSLIHAGVLGAQGGPADHVAAGWLAGRAAGHAEDRPRSGHFPGGVLITLHDPDYSRFFSCCSVKHVIADGLMLSFKLSRVHFEHPWQAPGDAAVVYAPRFAERLLIPKVTLRKALLQYCGGGLEPRDLAILEGALGDEGLDCLLFLLKRSDIGPKASNATANTHCQSPPTACISTPCRCSSGLRCGLALSSVSISFKK